MKVIKYAVRLRHDAGVVTLVLCSSSAVSAVRQVLDIEHAPPSAVVCVRQVAVVYATPLAS